MNVDTLLEMNAVMTDVMQPAMRAFDDPAISAKFGPTLGDHRLDADPEPELIPVGS